MKTIGARLGWPLAALYGCWALLRLALHPALEFDEAEQVIHQQWLLPLYGPQPPLVEWLVWVLRHALGLPALSALIVLKAGALWGIGMAAAWWARQAGLSATAASAAGWWVLTLPLLLWDAPRTLTHSLLAAAWVAALVACSAPLALQPRQRLTHRRWWLLAALACAALLSKYNAALALAGWLAVIGTAWWRHSGGWVAWWALVKLHAPRAGPAALAALALLAAHLATVAQAWPEVGQTIAARMMPDPAASVAAGLAALMVAWLAVLSVPALVLGLAGLVARKPPEPRELVALPAGHAGPQAAVMDTAWMWRAYALTVGALLLGLVALGVLAEVKERWLLPLAVPLQMLTAAWALQRQGGWAQALGRLSAALVAVALALLLGRAPILAWLGEPSWSQLPARAAAQWVDRLGPSDALVVAEPIHLAGALAAHGRRGRAVLHRGASRLLWGTQQVCQVVEVHAGPLPEPAADWLALGLRPAASEPSVALPRAPQVQPPVTLTARLWRAAGPTCPTPASLYDRLP
ncbi:Lipopolysaccharide core galacturonosyltransferase RgtC [Tepidimonas alkaliphilus]|uniref:Lipopolysaccharide core galacturonosyltransferase RgtC n=1 Tax=Tepidimonas alkaliphilus TaxID=2588942 RepID=A0A554WDU4_9BURK|nr:hypothetical protein [Tepidimonas alkaliphilus]TSE21722.1 Lipopolysaccharide core galacturonosyltransferase RgtC [Tepidimonas alkaliphilus]